VLCFVLSHLLKVLPSLRAGCKVFLRDLKVKRFSGSGYYVNQLLLCLFSSLLFHTFLRARVKEKTVLHGSDINERVFCMEVRIFLFRFSSLKGTK
jgi:uncharacterized membrane protein YiaA